MPIYQRIKNNRLYFPGLLLFLLAGVAYLTIAGWSAGSLSLNDYHPFWLNVFFINYTFLGDGIFAIGLVCFYKFYLRRNKEAMTLFCALIISELLVQLVKNMVAYPHTVLFFEPGEYLFLNSHTVNAYEGLFPSGHTAIVFTIITVMVMMHTSSRWQLILLLAGALEGFSRIYLAGNAAIDILTGTLMGTGAGIMATALVNRQLPFKRSFRVIHKIKEQTLISPPGLSGHFD